MGLFDFLKKKPVQQAEPIATEKEETVEELLVRETAAIPPEERQFYQRESYYTAASYPDSGMGRPVVPFETRKKTAFPSKNGLYPAEILLLSYCSGYPNPGNGYPGFWWFEYGIRDVGAALRSLESRGFLRWATAKESLDQLRVPQLKEALASFGLPVSGKRAELVERLQGVEEARLAPLIPQPKYRLTPLGEQELDENEYVPYMHSARGKTTENDRFGPTFNLWTVNRQLAGDTEHWTEVVEQQRAKVEAHYKQNHERFLQQLQKTDPAQAAEFIAQDKLLAQIQQAEKQYIDTGDVEALIAFWEDVWAKGSVTSFSSHWHFRLADLYIQQKRYPEAEAALEKIKEPSYQERVQSYRQRVEKLKTKKRPRT